MHCRVSCQQGGSRESFEATVTGISYLMFLPNAETLSIIGDLETISCLVFVRERHLRIYFRYDKCSSVLCYGQLWHKLAQKVETALMQARDSES